VAAAVFCSAVLREIGKTEFSFLVTFLNDEEMRKINKKYRQRDYPTDVLSFVYDETQEDGSQFAGEIIIAPDVAVRNAARYRNQAENEVRKLLVHGILHLFGYDHETDDGSMRRLQRRLTGRVFFKKGESVLKRNKAYP